MKTIYFPVKVMSVHNLFMHAFFLAGGTYHIESILRLCHNDYEPVCRGLLYLFSVRHAPKEISGIVRPEEGEEQ